ncbi:Inosine/uridine-preferring nucleoside hydrolase [Cynara cardunculus var. scolymus]|uniref:Inosine/uridine-preferring nucleoside hydrolase n=1 Tax=Cynara cardunculus var. scolymus TaxID=59895 RepID=A0A103XD30_CYNCS|nr:Inosine/uridine-preferring nucleoside hydrolase [Cynara cardunculus var. scolymus]
MAIFLALRSPEIKVIGLTTIYGNVYTTLATRNALHLLEFAGRTDIPVAEGSHVSYMKATKLRVADFVHGVDGLGNQNFPQPKSKPIEKSAAEYLIKQANLYPGEVTVVALGPLTNIALVSFATLFPFGIRNFYFIGTPAIQLDPAFAKNIGQIVLLGGAFAVNGNVNPAAEANKVLTCLCDHNRSSLELCAKNFVMNSHFISPLGLDKQIFGDPEAADIVFTSGADVLAVGINVTHQVIMKDDERDKLAQSDGMFAKYLCKILDYYFSYHRDAYSMKGVYLHDPTALVAAINPSLMTYTEGVVRVQTTGITRGLTLFFNKQKRFEEATEWCNKPTVKVAVTVDAHAVIKLVMERLMNS